MKSVLMMVVQHPVSTSIGDFSSPISSLKSFSRSDRKVYWRKSRGKRALTVESGSGAMGWGWEDAMMTMVHVM